MQTDRSGQHGPRSNRDSQGVEGGFRQDRRDDNASPRGKNGDSNGGGNANSAENAPFPNFNFPTFPNGFQFPPGFIFPGGPPPPGQPPPPGAS